MKVVDDWATHTSVGRLNLYTEQKGVAKLSKEALITRAREASSLSKKDTEAAWNALQEAIHEQLKAGEEVTIVGVGKLKPATRAARTGRNPQTGQALQIPEKHTVKLVVSTRY